jgi:hypothetical protein
MAFIPSRLSHQRDKPEKLGIWKLIKYGII